MKDEIKSWVDANVWDGDDRSGCKNDFARFDPDDLQELFDDCFDDVIGSRIAELEARNKALEDAIEAHKKTQIVDCIYRDRDVILWALLDKGE